MRIATLATLAGIVALQLAPDPAVAEPTVACHCFRNRSFDPADPEAADPYILATARSSLLSASLGVPKASLVRAVMSGTAAEDLWVAHWAGARTGKDPDSLLEAIAGSRSWTGVLAGAKNLPEAFGAALARGGTSAELAAIAIDDVLVNRLAAAPDVILALRSAGATSEQVILSTFLGARLQRPAAEVLSTFRSGKASWGALLRDAGLAPDAIDAAMRTSLR